MSKDPAPPFGIPPDMRTLAEQSVEQARTAFNTFINAAHDAVGRLDVQAKAAQEGARGLSGKAVGYAESNVAAAFDFAQKVVRATTPQELVKLQAEFIQAQMQALSAQAKDLGEATKDAMTSSNRPR